MIHKTPHPLEERSPDNKIGKESYWKVFLAGILYILLLGAFTFLFNNPL